ncbi:UNVERIFIED_CONTAM: hypothetical protein FKN15_030924 [Acipenser sinensis]
MHQASRRRRDERQALKRRASRCMHRASSVEVHAPSVEASTRQASSVEVRAPSVERRGACTERRVSRCMRRASRRRRDKRRASRCVHRASSVEVRAPSVDAPKRRASRCMHRASRCRCAQRRAPKRRALMRRSVERRGACTERRCAEASSVEVRAPSVKVRAPSIEVRAPSVEAPMRRASSAEASSVEVRALSVDASKRRASRCVHQRAPNPKCRGTKHQAQKRCTKRRSAAPSAEALTPKAPERERLSAGTERGTLAQTPKRQLTRRAETLSAGTMSDAVQYLPDGAGDFSQQELPQASLSCGDGGFGPRAAAEGDEETSPEAEPTLSLVSEARKGGEEPERAEGGALKADPLPAVQRGQETGPRPSIEGPVPVTEGAQEEPLKQLLPRASLSGGGEGSGPCAAVGGETEAVPVTDAEAGEGPERVYPLSLGEGGEGPERVDPLPSRAEGGPETVPRTSKEGPRAGKTRPSGSAAYAERPSAPPKSRVQTVPARVPPPISPAASPGGGALGESVKIKIRRNALTHQRECVVLLHREGGGGEPEEREEDSESACSVGSESLSAPSPDIPAADLLEFLEATVHRRDKVQLALDKWGDFQRILTSVRSFLRASHANKTSGSNVHIRARKLHDQLVSFGRTQDLP